MSDNREFDPRFNPAFQRGYDGPLPDASAPARETASPPARAVAAEPAPLPRLEASAAPDQRDEYDDRFIESEVAGPRRVNPFLIVLGAVSAVLVGGGLLLVSRLRDLFADTQSSSSFDYVTLQVLTTAAPLVICLGLATAIGVLFVFAVRWNRWN